MSRFVAIALSALFAFSLPAAAQEAKPAAETFKDWGRQCEQPKGMEQEICYIFQNLTVKESGKHILNVTVGYPVKQETPVLGLVLPLGVSLKAGLQLQVDSLEPVRFAYDVCTQMGCRAFLPLDEGMINAMKKGEKVLVTFANMQRKGVGVPVSLAGFTKAFSTLR